MKHAHPSEFENASPAAIRPELPSQTELLEAFCYDPETGKLFNRATRGGKAKAGEEAGTNHAMRAGIKDRWYRRVVFKGKRYLAHVLVIIMLGGTIAPGFEIDHKNGVGVDNRAENLRIVTHSQNMLNTKRHRD